MSVTITAIGRVHERGRLLRSTAEPGDVVIVTGDFGASRAGLWLMLEQYERLSNFKHCRDAHFRPQPRFCESWSMVRRTEERGALMDASDGLADALAQICRASRVGMKIDLERLPIHAETRAVAALAGENPLNWALYGGEDYELVGSVSQEIWASWQDDNPFTAIGIVTANEKIDLCLDGKVGPQLNLAECFEQIDF